MISNALYSPRFTQPVSAISFKSVIIAAIAVLNFSCSISSVTFLIVLFTAISVTDGAYKVGSYDSFSGSKTIALKINSCVTKGAGKMSIAKDAFPKIGAAQNLPLTYFAKVSGDAPNSKDVQAANVVFTISIVG